MQGLVSHLRPDDLVALTTTCQNINSQMRMNEAPVKSNLLTKTLCPGVGLEVRSACHCSCKTRGWHSYSGCGGEGYDVDSRPCIACGVNTCDECRIHVVYQVYMEDPGLDNRRWWAGHVLTDAVPIALHPPKAPDGASWNLPPDVMRPHHDQGRFHIPLFVYALADPEPLDRILDTDLGRYEIIPRGRISLPFDGMKVVGTFNDIARSREELVCLSCTKERDVLGSMPCQCTLRKRFLDRWVCIPCHLDEQQRVSEQINTVPIQETHGWRLEIYCRCGIKIKPDEYKRRCTWCDGHIADTYEHEESHEDDDDDVSEAHKNNDDEDDNAGPAPIDSSVGTLIQVDNKDGTSAVYHNGTRISGERLSRGMVLQWAARKGAKLPCQCCTDDCPGGGCSGYYHHHHRHGSSGEESVAGNDPDDRESEGDSEGEGLVGGTLVDFGQDDEDSETEVSTEQDCEESGPEVEGEDD
jgi:hypothetical protein